MQEEILAGLGGGDGADIAAGAGGSGSGSGRTRTAVGVKATAQLAMFTGVFNLLWATVTILMIVRPGSTTGG